LIFIYCANLLPLRGPVATFWHVRPSSPLDPPNKCNYNNYSLGFRNAWYLSVSPMSWNAQFTFAVHALTLIANGGNSPVKSEAIASSVNTNPVVIRRILCDLNRAGLVTSQMGSGGGFRLGRHADKINLLDVYRATQSGGVFCLQRRGGMRANPRCPVGKNIERVLGGVFDQANQATERVLSAVTLEDLLREMNIPAAGPLRAGD
jgi:Rrf2 family protein